MMTDYNVSATRFKLIVYKFAFDDFDPFDFYDFSGKRIIDKDSNLNTDYMNIPVSNDEIDKKIKEINDNSRKTFTTDIGSALPSSSMALHKKIPTVREYITQYIKDEKSYDIKSKPSLSLNWKTQTTDGNLENLSKPHTEYLSKKIEYFKSVVLNKSLDELVKANSVVERDISESIISVGTHQTQCDSFKNEISFTLNLNTMPEDIRYLQENFVVDFYADFLPDENDSGNYTKDSYKYGAYRGPSTTSELRDLTRDIINPDLIHTRRFIGIITSIGISITPGGIPTCDITCEGIYSYLARNNLVKNKAIATFFEKYPYDLKQPGVPVFTDNLNALSVNQVFDYVLYHALDLRPYLLGVQDNSKIRAAWLANTYLQSEPPENIPGILSDSRFREVTGLTFKSGTGSGLTVYRRPPPEEAKEVRDLTSWSMLAYLYFIVHDKFRPEMAGEVMSQKLENEYRLDKFEYALADICGIAEGNEYNIRAYALQVKTAHATFYNQFGSGVEILRNLGSYTYFDMFEDRPGVLVCRPSRDNNIFIDSPASASLFIIDPKEVLSLSYSRSDKDLSSRVDYTPTLPLKGELNPRFCLNYADSQLLYKYGANLKESGPIGNPNVVLYNYMPFFAAVALVQRNALTRTLELSAVALRDYCLGRVYFIPDFFVEAGAQNGYSSPKDMIGTTGWVGRLSKIDTTYDVDHVPKHKLVFIMARRGKIIEDKTIEDKTIEDKTI
jgi:hypothetical protein